MTTIPRRESLPTWPGPHVNPGPPPFQGAPPPMPAGYAFNQQQWSRGVWVPNPQWNPHQYPASNNAWMPGASWGPNPAFPHPGYPNARPPPPTQQQQSFNPYKRQVKPPSAEYLSQPISNNGLQLESLVEARDRYGDEQQLSGPKTPWIWNPMTLQNDGESPARASRQNSVESNSSSSDTSSVTSSDYDSSSTERGQHSQYPIRHHSEPVVQQPRHSVPPIAAPLARHATEPASSESFTSKMELRPTFSPKVVVTSEHYKSPRSQRVGSLTSLHSTYNEHGAGGPVEALSEQLRGTRFDSFSSGSSGSGTSSGMFSSPATASSFSSYGSGSGGSFGSGISPSKTTHGDSRSIAGLASLSDEPEPIGSDGSADPLSPIRIGPALTTPGDAGRRKHRQKHEPSPLRREATEPAINSAVALATIPESYGYDSAHRRRQSSRQGSVEPEDHYLGGGLRYGTPGHTMTPPSPQVTPRPPEDGPSRSHSRTPSRQNSGSSFSETPSRRGSSRYSPPDSASYRPSSRQASLDTDRHHPLTPPEPQGRDQFEPADRAAHLRPYNPLPEPPRYHDNRQRTPPRGQHNVEETIVLQPAPNSRSRAGSYSSQIYAAPGESGGSYPYPTPHDGSNPRSIPPATPKRSPPVSPSYATPAGATGLQVQQPTPRHTPLSFDPHAGLQLPISPRPSRTPVPVDQPSIPLPKYRHVPMPNPPNVPLVTRNVRAGYWNKRGDHMTSTGYVVYAPREMQYPGDLRDYPDVREGYKNDQGFIIEYEQRPELINSMPRDGKPPVTSYSEFISYRTRQIPITRSNEIPS